MPGLGENNANSRIPVLPVNLYDLGVRAGESRGGHGGATIPARMLVKLAAAPSTSVRHGERFVTYDITLRDIRNALYPPEYLDGRPRQLRSVAYMWPRVHQAIRIINQEARIPVLDPKTGYGHFHHILRINENFGKIDLDMPIGVVLDIPPMLKSLPNATVIRPFTGRGAKCPKCPMWSRTVAEYGVGVSLHKRMRLRNSMYNLSSLSN